MTGDRQSSTLTLGLCELKLLGRWLVICSIGNCASFSSTFRELDMYTAYCMLDRLTRQDNLLVKH